MSNSNDKSYSNKNQNDSQKNRSSETNSTRANGEKPQRPPNIVILENVLMRKKDNG